MAHLREPYRLALKFEIRRAATCTGEAARDIERQREGGEQDRVSITTTHKTINIKIPVLEMLGGEITFS